MRRLFWFALLMLALLSLATIFLNYGLLPQAWRDLLASGQDGAALKLPSPKEPVAEADPAGPETAAPKKWDGGEMESLAAAITAGAAGEYERMAAIYDWVTANFAYDLKRPKMERTPEPPTCWKRGGVCQDFAELTRQL